MLITFALPNAESTKKFGEIFSSILPKKICCFLMGEVGMGKTSLVQSILKSLGVKENISSPTFSLVESYKVEEVHIAHIDLYRISSPVELEYTGILDTINTTSMSFIEWPEKGEGCMPTPDIIFNLHSSNDGRILTLQDKSNCGTLLLANITNDLFGEFTIARNTCKE